MAWHTPTVTASAVTAGVAPEPDVLGKGSPTASVDDDEAFLLHDVPELGNVAAEAQSLDVTQPQTWWSCTLQVARLLSYVSLWYFFNVKYNIVNKRVLKAFPASLAVSWFQLVSGVMLCLGMWALRLQPLPLLSKGDVVILLPSAICFAVGQVATVQSLAASNVSFTHIVKALEPAVNAVMSAALLGQVFHPAVYCSLTILIAGVTLASVEDASFAWYGLGTAMLSNVSFALRNVLATKHGSIGDMGEGKISRKTNQLAVLALLATAVSFPLAVFAPGGLGQVYQAWETAMEHGVSDRDLLFMIAESGFHFFMYQVSSFWVLSGVQPLTHSVLNSVKRAVVIVSAIVLFNTPVTTLGSLGIALTLCGVLIYTGMKSYCSRREGAIGI